MKIHEYQAKAILAKFNEPVPRGQVATSTAEAEAAAKALRSEEHTSELQSPCNLVCRLLLEKKNNTAEQSSDEISVIAGSEQLATSSSNNLPGRLEMRLPSSRRNLRTDRFRVAG